jgi:YVTN family beta-propeller protein
MISYDFQEVSAQVSNSTTTNSTSVPTMVITLGGKTTGGIAYDPIHKTMYVANIEPNTVSVIDTTTHSVIGNPIPASKQPQIAAYDPIHKTMYMTNIGPTGCTFHGGCVPPVGIPSYVTVINTTTNSVIRNIPVGLDPFGIAYDPIHHTMYVANSGSNTVSIINTTTNSVIANPVTGDNNATGIAYEPIHHRMYMTHNHDLLRYSHYTNSCPAAPLYACHKGNVSAISTTPPYSVIGRPIPADIDPYLIAYDPLHHRMYVTNSGSDKVFVVDVQ